MKDILKKIFITGTGSGLGEALYNKCQEKKYEVYSHSRDGKTDIVGDINKRETQEEISRFFIEKELNILINNHAVYSYKDFELYSDDEILEIFQTNFFSVCFITKRILPFYKKNKFGKIYNINSVAGLRGSKYESIYSSTKHALKGLSESLEEECREYKNIKITNVTLSAFKSKMTKDRDTFSILSDPSEIAEEIINHFEKNYETINTNLTIYRNYGTID